MSPIYFIEPERVKENENSAISFQKIWKPINDWEELYLISNFGDVYSLRTNKLIAGDKNNYNYQRVKLYDGEKSKRYFRHRLVASHFLDNPQNKKFVNHITGDKNRNEFFNIEYATQSENEKHAFRTGLKKKMNKPFIVEKNNGLKLKYENQSLFAKDYKISQPYVSDMIKNKRYIDDIKNIYFID